MELPLGSSLANAFLSYYEKNRLNSCLQGFRPVFYQCYVDDIFVLFKLNDHLKYFREFLNCCHINVSFSMETERQNKISCFGIKVICEQGIFSATIYHKPTFSGVCSNCEVFYLLFINLVWYTPWFIDVFVFARIGQSSMQN